MSTNAVALRELNGSGAVDLASAFMPVMQMQQAVQRYNALLSFTQEIMKAGKDYGTIPGVDKPSLFKPGAEKLCNFFGLTPKFVVVKETEQWEGDEPFFYYWYKCQLWRGSVLIAEGDGSCNSRESKYRYRWVASDQVPSHLKKDKIPFRPGKATEPDFAIEKAETGGKYGKPAEYWQAFKDAIANGTAIAGTKQSSTGRAMKTWSIEQPVYRIPNPDISDVVNTIQKMSQKRALVAVTLIGCNASEYFTQDIEDMQAIDVPYSVIREEASKIDTGGHPVGTQAAANHVAEEKLRQQASRRQSEPPMGDPPPSDQPEQAQPSTLEQLLASFSQTKNIGPAFDQMRSVLDPAVFDGIVTENGIGPGQPRQLSKIRAAFSAMWAAYHRQMQEGPEVTE